MATIGLPNKPLEGVAAVEEGPRSDEITLNFVDIAWRLIHGFWLIALLTLLGFGAGLAALTVVKPYYVAQAVFLPPKNTDLNTAVSSGSLLAGDESVDIYLGLLASRDVADDIIDRLDLMRVFKAKEMGQARGALAGGSSFSVSKNALITVSVKTLDPKLSADIANAYLEALYRLNGKMVSSASSHRRTFFEEQLEEQKVALTKAELDLKNTQVSTGIVLPSGEAQAAVNATAELQASLGQAQAKLAAAEISGTDRNPEVVQARSLVNQLQGQLARQEADSGKDRGIASNSRMPGLQLEYEQKAREVKLREGLYDALVQQYERARLASIDPGPQLEVVELAIPPEHKAGPSKKSFALTGALIGLALSLMYLLFTTPVRHFVRLLRNARPAMRS